jgi:hypothetical protein
MGFLSAVVCFHCHAVVLIGHDGFSCLSLLLRLPYSYARNGKHMSRFIAYSRNDGILSRAVNVLCGKKFYLCVDILPKIEWDVSLFFLLFL